MEERSWYYLISGYVDGPHFSAFAPLIFFLFVILSFHPDGSRWWLEWGRFPVITFYYKFHNAHGAPLGRDSDPGAPVLSYKPRYCVAYSPTSPKVIPPPVRRHPFLNHHQQFRTFLSWTFQIIKPRERTALPQLPTKKTGPQPAATPAAPSRAT